MKNKTLTFGVGFLLYYICSVVITTQASPVEVDTPPYFSSEFMSVQAKLMEELVADFQYNDVNTTPQSVIEEMKAATAITWNHYTLKQQMDFIAEIVDVDTSQDCDKCGCDFKHDHEHHCAIKQVRLLVADMDFVLDVSTNKKATIANLKAIEIVPILKAVMYERSRQ